ncbi:hypothetical protein SDC9_182320 [bioreactor metagenome]|uniref:Uncharacterized protein n=1 Tax=bioreactor metagenome TaxID=1076179 RepID=A0A645H8J5_9ZZZZ
MKADGGIKEIQKGTPFLKNGLFIALLGQLIVDIQELNGFGIITVCYPADPIRVHLYVGNGLLGCFLMSRLGFALCLGYQGRYGALFLVR